MKRQGRCLCGAVHVTASESANQVGACHCSMCRRWGGGPFMAIGCGSDVLIEGRENLSVFESSKWAERGFCNNCGTHLFYRIKETGDHMIPVGLLDGDETLELHHQVFIDEKPSFYCFDNETEDMTGAQVFAKYGSSL